MENIENSINETINTILVKLQEVEDKMNKQPLKITQYEKASNETKKRNLEKKKQAPHYCSEVYCNICDCNVINAFSKRHNNTKKHKENMELLEQTKKELNILNENNKLNNELIENFKIKKENKRNEKLLNTYKKTLEKMKKTYIEKGQAK